MTRQRRCFLEHRICTSSNSAEQYCPLFKIFDCHPFTGECCSMGWKRERERSIDCPLDLECGLKTIPVHCADNHCQNQGSCYVDMLQNSSRCVCSPGKYLSLRSRGLEYPAALHQDSPVISANTPSTSVNRARVLDTAAAWICPTVTRACAVSNVEG